MLRLFFCLAVFVLFFFNSVDQAAPELDADSGAIIRSPTEMVTNARLIKPLT